MNIWSNIWATEARHSLLSWESLLLGGRQNNPTSSQSGASTARMHARTTPEKKMGTDDLIGHMGEFGIFVPFVGVFVCIVALIVCRCKGRMGKETSDIESKVLAGELQLKIFWH